MLLGLDPPQERSVCDQRARRNLECSRVSECTGNMEQSAPVLNMRMEIQFCNAPGFTATSGTNSATFIFHDDPRTSVAGQVQHQTSSFMKPSSGEKAPVHSSSTSHAWRSDSSIGGMLQRANAVAFSTSSLAILSTPARFPPWKAARTDIARVLAPDIATAPEFKCGSAIATRSGARAVRFKLRARAPGRADRIAIPDLQMRL